MTLAVMRRLRAYHHGLGVLFAPAVLFLAVGGALQTDNSHERRADALGTVLPILLLAA